jgi:hypothetical protein
MEFDKPSTKYAFTFVVLITAACLAGLIGTMIRYDLKESAEARDRQLACNSLNPKYGSLFVVRSGFYEGQLFEAVELKRNEYIRGNILQDLRPLGLVKSTENIVLECPILMLEEEE